MSIFLSFTFPAFGQDKTIGFVNGVFTTKEKAIEAAEDLAETYRIENGISSSEFGAEYQWALYYNETACPDSENPNAVERVSCLADLFEAGVQQGGIEVARQLWELEDAIVKADPTVELTEELLQQAADALIAFSEAVIDEHTLGIRNQIQVDAFDGQKTALVMHSQGNFFGNDAWNLLRPEVKPRVQPISVATPDSVVEGNGPYRTVRCDFIHLVPGALEDQLIESISCDLLDLRCRFMICHAFTSYLGMGEIPVSDGVARNLILNDIKAVFEENQPPPESLVVDGSFDQGDTFWFLSGDFWAGTNLSNYRSAFGYSAGGVDVFGNHKNGASGTLSQFVEIPDNFSSARISFWVNVTTDEQTETERYDTFAFRVFDETGVPNLDVQLDLSNLDAVLSSRSYTLYEFDIPEAIGRTVLLRFEVTTDDTLPTVFRIDDVSVVVE